jgi:hypothetical protein
MRAPRLMIAMASIVVAASATAALLAGPATKPSDSKLSEDKSSEAMACTGGACGSCPGETMGVPSLVGSLFDRATTVADIENGLRFHFANQPGLLNDIVKVMDGSEAGLTDLKSTLAVNPAAGEIVLDLIGNSATAEKLRKL